MLLTLTFWRSIWRTFFIQAAWNFERMQNLGFLYVMLPVLRQIRSGPAFDEAVRRHVQFFNTHPYFASTIVGATIKLEEDAARDGGDSLRSMNALKVGLMGSLGAIGDSLFWAALRPLCAWLAVFLVVLGRPLAALLVFLLLYNLPHLIVRFGGAAVGYAAGLDVVRQLRRVDFPHLAQRLKGAAVFVAFATLPLLAYAIAGEPELRSAGVAVAGLLLVIVSRGIGGTRLAALFLSVILIGTWVHHVLGGN
jgi:PTS system mannose-specific IID component